jgi:ABC-2 type transport system ATP-binding protein
MITANGLTKRFGAVTAVDSLDLTVHPGEVMGFLGPNGAGKTTTMRLLLGYLRPTAGTATVLGGSLAREPGLRRRVGYLPGDLRMDPGMTGADLFTYVGRLRGEPAAARVHELVDRLGLDPAHRFGVLSKGNRQKVGLVQALCHDPDVLILDEPTTGLDPLAQRELLTLVRAAADRGAAVLFSTHVLSEVERVAGWSANPRRSTTSCATPAAGWRSFSPGTSPRSPSPGSAVSRRPTPRTARSSSPSTARSARRWRQR